MMLTLVKKIIFICFIILTMIRIMQICTLIIIGQFGLMNHFVWFLERQKGKSFWFWLRYFNVEYMCSFNLHSVILKPQAFGNISEIVLLLEFEMRIERQFLFKYVLFPYCLKLSQSSTRNTQILSNTVTSY